MVGVDWDVSLQMIQQKNAGGGLDGSERRARLKEQLLEKLTIMKIKVFLNYLCHFSVGTATLVLRQYPRGR